MHNCAYTFVGICLNRASDNTEYSIFGFSEFLTALALLILVFSSSDFLYQFRVSVAALPLRTISFVATVGIGVGTLLTDLWFAEHWYAPALGVSRGALQGIFGALFLSTVLLWIWFAYMRPPVFSRWNFKHFFQALFHAVVRGSDTQLAVIAGELARSADGMVRLWDPKAIREVAKTSPPRSHVAGFANDAMLLLSNRKLCRHIIASSPVTAIAFMQEAAKQEKYQLPLGGFARKITEEALRNRDSILFHEDELGADVLGMVQPFSKAMYGNYKLVEGISRGIDGPLDIDWRLVWDLDGNQFETYCRIVLLTFKDYIASGSYRSRSTVLYRAFEQIQRAGQDIYKLDKQPTRYPEAEATKRLSAAVEFVGDVIDFLAEYPDLKIDPMRRREDTRYINRDIFDSLAELMFELVFQASSVSSTPDNAWWIHYNIVWGPLLGFRKDSRAWRVIRRRFFRLLFDEIKRMEKFPNYKGARVLGFCLNVLGLTINHVTMRDRDEYPLRVAVLNWARRNYLTLVETLPPVADACLIGSITFDREYERLVKTYAQGLNVEPSREYLPLAV